MRAFLTTVALSLFWLLVVKTYNIYNFFAIIEAMKEFLKEFGKLIYDFAKIIFAVAIITPLIKDGSFSLYAIGVAGVLVVLGSIIIYKGGER